MKVLVTTPFTLNLGFVDGLPKEVQYEAGAQDMPEDHFKHWWTQMHGVKSLENASMAMPVSTPKNVQPIRKPESK
jgi:hypothetical protein